MYKFFLLAILYSSILSLQADQQSREKYLQWMQDYPSLTQALGDSSKGEIQIVQDPHKMAEFENLSGMNVGVIAESPWGWAWINEVCRFQNGHETIFGRIVLKQSFQRKTCVAVMPMTTDDKIILICNFRHATRSWEIELPRGFIDAGESIFEAARREALEETGMVVQSERLLGEFPPDNGITSTLVSIVTAKVIEQKNNAPEQCEAIEKVLSLTIPEIKEAFLNGFLSCTIRGTEKRVPFRDPFLAYALLMYEITQSKHEG